MKRVTMFSSLALLAAFVPAPASSQDDPGAVDRVRRSAAQSQQELDAQENHSARPRPTPAPATQVPARTAILYISPDLTGSDKTNAEDRAAQEADALRKQGYKVVEKPAHEQDILDDLWNGVEAVAFFGHGGTDTSGNATSTFAGRTAEGWKASIFSDFRLRYVKQGMTLEDAERKTNARLARLGIKLMRNFSCRSLHDRKIADLFVDRGGRYYGAPSTLTGGALAQTISANTPDVCSGLLGYSYELTLYPVEKPEPAPEAPPVPPAPPAASQGPNAIHYVIDKVTGTSYAGTPRDTAEEKTGDIGLSGTIPLSYSESWETGYANMTGSVSLSPAQPGPGARPDEVWITVAAQASWSNKGLGFGRPTGIFIRGGADKDAVDDKGSFDNGSTSAAANWTGPLAGGVTIRVTGKENRIVTLAPLKP